MATGSNNNNNSIHRYECDGNCIWLGAKGVNKGGFVQRNKDGRILKQQAAAVVVAVVQGDENAIYK